MDDWSGRFDVHDLRRGTGRVYDCDVGAAAVASRAVSGIAERIVVANTIPEAVARPAEAPTAKAKAKASKAETPKSKVPAVKQKGTPASGKKAPRESGREPSGWKAVEISVRESGAVEIETAAEAAAKSTAAANPAT